jgi:hypothetical protein
MAGVATMAVAINAADRSLNVVIRFLHWIVKRPNRGWPSQVDIGSGFINTTKLQFRPVYRDDSITRRSKPIQNPKLVFN